MSTTTRATASDKQMAFIQKLLADRVLTDGQKTAADNLIDSGMNVREASTLIDWLMACPKTPLVHEDGNAVGEGYYLQEDTVYKVVKAKSTGNLYAKALHSTERGHASWDYSPGAMRHLAGANRLTLDQAREMGTRLGVCVICGAALTDPESVERGIGPVCATRV